MQPETDVELVKSRVVTSARRHIAAGPVRADRIAGDLGVDMATVVSAMRSLAPERLEVEYDETGSATVIAVPDGA